MTAQDDLGYTTYSPDQLKEVKKKLNMERERNIIIVDGKGTERKVYPPIELPPDIKRPEIDTYEQGLEWNKLAQEHTDKALSFTQEYAKTKYDPVAGSNRILLVNIADLHWGHMDVDYDFLDKNLGIIEHTPNIVCLATWNLLDAAIPSQFPDGVMWSGQNAQEQVYTFRDKLRRLHEKGKLIAAIGDSSCHEGWSKRQAGWMIYRELFEGIDCPLLLNGGYLDLVVGQETYRMGLFHKTKYWSQLNKTHGGERMLDRISNSEIIFTSHHHQAGTGQSTRYNPPFSKETAVVSSGTSKLRDKFARGHWGSDGEPGFQGIMLWADKHKFNVVYDLGVGKELMIDAIRNEEARKLQAFRDEVAKIK